MGSSLVVQYKLLYCKMQKSIFFNRDYSWSFDFFKYIYLFNFFLGKQA